MSVMHDVMNQECDVGYAFPCLSHCQVKKFFSNSCYVFSVGPRIDPGREILSLLILSEETSPAHNLRQSHSTKPVQVQPICSGLQAINMKRNVYAVTEFCYKALL